MATALKLKPVKPAAKQKNPAQTASAAPENASAKTVILSSFEQRLRALRQRYLGPPLGEPGKDGRFQAETSKCESSTKRGILDAHATEKLEAFVAGFSQLQESLCGAAVACYSDCMKLVEDNRSECEAPPADFATSFTQECLSTFLKVTALDSAGEDRETASNRRVGWFVRHVCYDWSDDFPSLYGLRAGESRIFHLPQYLSDIWMVRAKAANLRGVEAPAIGSLSIGETDTFILDKERTLIKELQDAIADARREALIGLDKIGTATAISSKAVADAAESAKKLPEDAHHDGKNQSSLPITDDYQGIRFNGERYQLTPQSARIVKVLDEARMRGIDQLSTQAIKKEAGCGKKISDSFRTGDGPKVWKRLVVPVEGCKGWYKLNLPCHPG